MHSLTCMSVVVCVVRKPRPCNSYSRSRDRINSVLWRSYYKGGGVKHFFGPSFCAFHLIWVLGAGRGGGGSPKGLVHNLLMQFFALDGSKIEVFEIYFFDTVIT